VRVPCAIAASCLAACGWDLERMMNQPRCEADEATTLLPGGTCNQVPPDGTIAWRSRAGEPEPGTMTRARLLRGRDRFEVFCAPCHGVLGDGRAEVAENMVLRAPPSLHEPRLRRAPDRHLYEVIGRGFGLMPAYGGVLAGEDRWAVVAYVRVLQVSQDAELAALPAPLREEAGRWLR
jgi:mono/diheme cytochrome c family protein